MMNHDDDNDVEQTSGRHVERDDVAQYKASTVGRVHLYRVLRVR